MAMAKSCKHPTCGDRCRREKPVKHRSPLVRKKKIKKTFKPKVSNKNEDDAFYEEIWNERPHVDYASGEPIFGQSATLNFHHVLGKKKGIHKHSDYSMYRHCKWNIVILSWNNHSLADKDLLPKVLEYKRFLVELHSRGTLQNVPRETSIEQLIEDYAGA